jgi:hypothetical protein
MLVQASQKVENGIARCTKHKLDTPSGEDVGKLVGYGGSLGHDFTPLGSFAHL